nr:MAG TPA: hypothetical protein [Caudoviricetes sp.]
MIFVHNIKQREPPASVTPLATLIYRLRLGELISSSGLATDRHRKYRHLF